MKQQIIQIIESHRPPMVHPTNRSGGEYAVSCEVDRVLDEVIRDVEKLEKNTSEFTFRIKNGYCVNSKYTASFLAKESNDCCQCSYGECKVAVEIEANGHEPRTFILTEKEIGEINKLSTNSNNNNSKLAEDMFKCEDCGHTLVRTRGQGMYCGICKK